MASSVSAASGHLSRKIRDLGASMRDGIDPVFDPAATKASELAGLGLLAHFSTKATDDKPTGPMRADARVLLDMLRAEGEAGTPTSALSKALGAKIRAEHSDEPATLSELQKLEVAADAGVYLVHERPMPSWAEVTQFWALVASGCAVIFLLCAPQQPSWAIWLFQLAAGVVAHQLATAHRLQLVGWMPPLAQQSLQPALLSSSFLICVAGASWADGSFLDGLDAFIMRTGEKESIFTGGVDGWGPGELLGVLLDPAVVVFAFSMSKFFPQVVNKLHVLVPVVLIAGVLSFVTSALLARLLVTLPAGGNNTAATDRMALAVIPHSVTTPLAMGFAPHLCQDGACAKPAVVATGCIITATGVMIAARDLLTKLGVKTPFARGIPNGLTGTALGVAALKAAGEEEATGVAAITYVAMCLVAAVCFSIHTLSDGIVLFAV